MFVAVVAMALGGLYSAWQHPSSRGKLTEGLNASRNYLNSLAAPYEPWQIIFVCVGLTLLLTRLYRFLCHDEKTLWQRAKLTVFRTLRKMPIISGKIKSELDKTLRQMQKDILTPKEGERYLLQLPEKGMSRYQLRKEMDNFDRMHSVDWKGGKVSGCAYNCNPQLTDITTEVYGRYSWTNPLHCDVYPQVRKMEAEVVQWCVKLFHGGSDAGGVMTSGGTESILMAMKAYRELAYERGISYPEIVCPKTAHCAFDKAADYFKMKLVHVPIDPTTCMVNLSAMARAINSNTIVLVGSAPQYPHGIIDPIEDIAKLAVKNNVGVHVDCCLGGFLLPFMDRAGFKLRPFDFRVKGVTSISADTHKFGYAPKGSSVILYSSKQIRKKQFFVSTDWPGGIYASPSIAGSRPGGIIAATWATMLTFGVEGYVDSTRKIISTARYIIQEINKMHAVHVMGNPKVSVIAIGSKEFDIYRLFAYMKEKGYSLNALQFPPCFHICLTLLHTQDGVAEQFVHDLKTGVTEIMRQPKLKAAGVAAMYGTSQSIPDRSIIGDIASGFIETLYQATPFSTNGK